MINPNKSDVSALSDMSDIKNNTIKKQNIYNFNVNGKEIIIVGTAHISKESIELVDSVIRKEKPDTVCVELCQSRYQSMVKKDQWEDTDIIKVIREKKAFLLLSNLILAAFQRKMAEKFDVRPGTEMIKAIETAQEIGAEVHLADRDIRITLARTWGQMGLWRKVQLLSEVLFSIGSISDMTEEDIEKMKQRDVLEAILDEIAVELPELRTCLIDERDQYLAHKITNAPGNKIVAVVGAGHLPGIERNIEKLINIETLELLPPKKKWNEFIKWSFPALIILMFFLGFAYSGKSVGIDMIKWWVIITGSLAGVGAALALGHPLTIASAVLAAPITTLHPLIAAGWVSGLVEAFTRKPKVRDFQTLSEDITGIRGFYRNKITRILLVVVFTNIGGSIGTFVAIPMLIKSFG